MTAKWSLISVDGPFSSYLPPVSFFGGGPSLHSTHMVTIEAACWCTEILVPVDGVGPWPRVEEYDALPLDLKLLHDSCSVFLGSCVYNTQTWVRLGTMFSAIWIGEAQKTGGGGGGRDRERGRERGMSPSQREGQRQEMRIALDVYGPATILPLEFMRYFRILISSSFSFLICLSYI